MSAPEKLKYLLSRASALYRDLGTTGLVHAGENYIRYGSFRHDVIGALPGTEPIVDRYVRIGHRVWPTRYTDARPLKLLWVEPGTIDSDISNSHIPPRFGRVFGGEWEVWAEDFEESTVFISLQEHFEANVPWDQTEYYRRKRAKLAAGEPTRGCTSLKDLPGYFERIDALYERMASDGYRTQRSLLTEAPSNTVALNLDAPTPTMNEIGVSIGPDGTLHRHFRGRHRLVIAKLLNVETVPVQVLVRHRDWQRMRSQLRRGVAVSEAIQHIPSLETETDLLGHPDLQDLISKSEV